MILLPKRQKKKKGNFILTVSFLRILCLKQLNELPTRKCFVFYKVYPAVVFTSWIRNNTCLLLNTHTQRRERGKEKERVRLFSLTSQQNDGEEHNDPSEDQTTNAKCAIVWKVTRSHPLTFFSLRVNNNFFHVVFPALSSEPSFNPASRVVTHCFSTVSPMLQWLTVRKVCVKVHFCSWRHKAHRHGGLRQNIYFAGILWKCEFCVSALRTSEIPNQQLRASSKKEDWVTLSK